MRALLVVLLVACAPSPPVDRYTSLEDHFSTVSLPTWDTRHDFGSVIFTDPSDSHHTIVVRTVPLSTSPERLVQATTKVLRAMPQAHLDGPETCRECGLAGYQYDLTFVPPNQDGTYTRKHYLLLGRSFAFHVMSTEPAGDRAANEAAVGQVLRYLREEG